MNKEDERHLAAAARRAEAALDELGLSDREKAFAREEAQKLLKA